MAVINEKLNKDAYSAATEMAKNGTGAQPSYAGTYDQQIAELYDRIQNREKFGFDLNGDALYKQYKDQAIQGGKLAMRDTMGQAAALTGGYGSSYAQSVGQQAYDAQLQKLNEVVPELYQQAYQRYRDEGTDLQQQYAMAGQMAADEYSKYRDQMSDWQYERAYEQQQEETAYSRQQDAYKQLYQMIAATGYQPTEAELKASGMSSAAATALRSAWEKANGTTSTGSSGGGSYSGGGIKSSKNSMSAEEYAAYYAGLGASPEEIEEGMVAKGYTASEAHAAVAGLNKKSKGGSTPKVGARTTKNTASLSQR